MSASVACYAFSTKGEFTLATSGSRDIFQEVVSALNSTSRDDWVNGRSTVAILRNVAPAAGANNALPKDTFAALLEAARERSPLMTIQARAGSVEVVISNVTWRDAQDIARILQKDYKVEMALCRVGAHALARRAEAFEFVRFDASDGALWSACRSSPWPTRAQMRTVSTAAVFSRLTVFTSPPVGVDRATTLSTELAHAIGDLRNAVATVRGGVYVLAAHGAGRAINAAELCEDDEAFLYALRSACAVNGRMCEMVSINSEGVLASKSGDIFMFFSACDRQFHETASALIVQNLQRMCGGAGVALAATICVETPLAAILRHDVVAAWQAQCAQGGYALGDSSLAHFVMQVLETPSMSVRELLNDEPRARAFAAAAEERRYGSGAGGSLDANMRQLLRECIGVWRGVHAAPLGDDVAAACVLPPEGERGEVAIRPVACTRAAAGNAAVRRAADVTAATQAISADLPPLGDDMVRLFHGGPATRVSAVANNAAPSEWQLSDEGDLGHRIFYTTPVLSYAVQHALVTYRDRQFAPVAVALLAIDVPRSLFDEQKMFEPNDEEWGHIYRFGWGATKSTVCDAALGSRKKAFKKAVIVSSCVSFNESSGQSVVPPNSRRMFQHEGTNVFMTDVRQFAFNLNCGVPFLRRRVLGRVAANTAASDDDDDDDSSDSDNPARDPRCRVFVVRSPVFDSQR